MCCSNDCNQGKNCTCRNKQISDKVFHYVWCGYMMFLVTYIAWVVA